jgi:hypothetical protein
VDDFAGVVDWLLGSDVSVRWQVMRDLLDAPEVEWQAERAKVETEGWGARLLAWEDDDGQWAGGAFIPAGFDMREWQECGQPWTATSFSLTQLRDFGLDPASDRARRAVELVGANSHWDEGGQPFWEGEVEECINGRTLADGAYFGVDVSAIASRLAGERLKDGGWNCERANGSERSSFATTINVLEGMLEYERATGGTPESRQARLSGEEYLLERHLFRRLSSGQPADEQFLELTYPTRWHYDILRALDYFRSAAALRAGPHVNGEGAGPPGPPDPPEPPDPRLADAVSHIRSRRLADGTWALAWQPKGRVWFEMDNGAGEPSPWVTLRAIRVIRWAEERPAA